VNAREAGVHFEHHDGKCSHFHPAPIAAMNSVNGTSQCGSRMVVSP
jgi:hypothetical protein